MRITQTIALMMAIFLGAGLLAVQDLEAGTGDATGTELTGIIAKGRNGYVIRSRRDNAPSEIYRILNPEPMVLDEFVKSTTVVSIEVRIVSGDNVEITAIDGSAYGQRPQ